MIPRFHLPDAVGAAGVLTLPPDEAHHLRDVLRLRPGATVQVFDGRGHEWTARIEDVGRRGVRVTLGDPVSPVPEPSARVTLALGVLKREYMDSAVRDAAMVGVAAIQPLTTTRTVVRLSEGRASGLLDRWRRIVSASVKQAGRAVMPSVLPPQPLARWLVTVSTDPALKLLLAEPRLAAPRERPDLETWKSRARSLGAYLLVGPEGGWLADEVEEARAAGFTPWTVSGRVLRADAAPVAALSVLFYAWDGR